MSAASSPSPSGSPVAAPSTWLTKAKQHYTDYPLLWWSYIISGGILGASFAYASISLRRTEAKLVEAQRMFAERMKVAAAQRLAQERPLASLKDKLEQEKLQFPSVSLPNDAKVSKTTSA